MKNKIKKIITTTIISAVSLTTIGCGTNNSKLAKNIDKSMENFVSSINNLDYVETSSAKTPTNGKIGKIVETSNLENSTQKINSTGNHIQFLNNAISEAEIENTITIPSERTDNFNLFVLSNTPYVTFTSDDNNSLNINVKFSTNQIEEISDEIENKINSLIVKRSILMIYVNEIYNGNVTITNENKLAINAYVNVIKENTSFLNGNRGMVKNQLSLASDLMTSETNDNLINYYIIKSSEALETRASKLDSTISAIDSIIKIIEDNLTSSSTYYQTNLSGTYDNLISNIKNSNSESEITENSTNQEIANRIACTLDFCNYTENSNESSTNNTNQFIAENSISNRNRQTQLNNTKTTPSTKIKSNENKSITLNQNTPNKTQSITEKDNKETKDISKTTETENNTNSNNQSIKRLPHSSRNRLRNRHNLNNSTINTKSDINEKYNGIIQNNDKNNLQNSNRNTNLRNTNMNNFDKTIRANRTPENNTHEEYSSTRTMDNIENRATRVPYKSTSTNFEQ